MSKIIGVDIDDTICASSKMYLPHVQKDFNVELNYEDITSFFFEDLKALKHIDCNWQEYFDNLLLQKHHLVEPEEDSPEILSHLKKLGHNMIAITARHTKHQENTHDWIKKHFPTLINRTIFLGDIGTVRVSKVESCLQNGVSLMIEDSIDHCLKLASVGIQCFLLERPWNCHRKEAHPLITKVKNWKEILQHLG